MEDTAQSTVERLPLEHPLPQEIRSMEKEDTVCKFCGVSYLIHREVKRLEDQVKAIEKELEHYKGSVEREKVLQEEVKQLKQNEEEMQKILKQKEVSISQMRADLQDKDELIQSLTQSRKGLEEKLRESQNEADDLRKQNISCKKSLPSIQASVRQQRSELHNIVTFVLTMKKSVQETSDVLNNTVQRVCASHSKETLTLQERIETLEEENKQSLQQQQSLQQAIKSAQNESQQLTEVQSQLRERQEICNKLRKNVENLQNEVDSALAKSKTSLSEAAQYKELVRSKTQEIEDIQQQHRRKEQVSEQLNTKLQSELKKKSEDLQSALNDCRKLQQQASETARIEEEIQRKATLNMTQTQEIKNALLKAQEECNTIKEERELMITSHQNRIEQLRESFKQKLMEAENWPQKMDDTLEKERSRHTQQLQDLEDKMKDAFQMELEIEKQKHQELVDRYKIEHQEATNKLKAELKSISSHHRAEKSQLEHQIHDAQSRASAGEINLKKEVHSLKSIINNLEDRLGKAGLEDSQTVANLKAELREAEHDLKSARGETAQMEEKLQQSKEEIMFLQETVRNECEERFELTEALSEAKEQLLSYQRHGALSPAGTRPSSAKRTSSREGGNKSGLVGSPNGIKQPQSPAGQKFAGSNSINIKQPQSPTGQKFAGSSSINLGFDSSNVQGKQQQVPAGRTKQGSMNDSRQRIAAAIGRK
ncbi:uncharacterized protein [Amphiura filiformis]|uniref:uncharacterized protein n=1 Tax=Amphiura filiformis TaxID=82378 RepID=UPI003B212121